MSKFDFKEDSFTIKVSDVKFLSGKRNISVAFVFDDSKPKSMFIFYNVDKDTELSCIVSEACFSFFNNVGI